MYDCTLNARSGKTDLTVVIVGHCDADVPAAVAAEASRMASGDLSGPQQVLTEQGRFLLLKPSDKPWLGGGESWRLLGQQIVAQLRAAKLTSALVPVTAEETAVGHLAEGALLGDYRYDVLRSGAAAKRPRLTLRLPGWAAAITRATRVAEAQNLARELADGPGNRCDPRSFVSVARKALRGSGITVSVISGVEALRTAGFPGLAQVGQAGRVPPALLSLRYRPTGKGKTKAKGKAKNKKTAPVLALVGKGVTFDAGGISLKPGSEMWRMKADMSGAAAVLGAMSHLARTQPSLAVDAYIGLAENMPDAQAQKPGDIYQARNGTYVHVDNTDAEGRLILADLLTYAGERGATSIVDLPTLTGACLVALGTNIAGLMGNDEAWLGALRTAGQEAGEEFWPLPLYGEYRRSLDHPHADINNIGDRYGGTITAGLFLREFVDPKIPWAHCDIAGPAMQVKGWRYYAKGMTGFGTRTLIRLIETMAGNT